MIILTKLLIYCVTLSIHLLIDAWTQFALLQSTSFNCIICLYLQFKINNQEQLLIICQGLYYISMHINTINFCLFLRTMCLYSLVKK